MTTQDNCRDSNSGTAKTNKLFQVSDKHLREALTLNDSVDEWMKPSLGMSVIVVGNDLYFVIKHGCVFTVPFINAIQYFETIR
jgi:hypothetical protein